MNLYDNDEYWMRHAMLLANRAESEGEIPVGAVLLLNGNMISESWNNSIKQHDPTAHAEIIALRQGGKIMKNYRLLSTVMYVTLEPCIMCIGAIIHARISRLVCGAKNKKYGSIEAVINIMNHLSANHNITLTLGVLSEDCSDQLSCFFRHRRN